MGFATSASSSSKLSEAPVQNSRLFSTWATWKSPHLRRQFWNRDRVRIEFHKSLPLKATRRRMWSESNGQKQQERGWCEMSCQSVLKKLQQPEMSCGSTTCRLSPIWFGRQRTRWIIISSSARGDTNANGNGKDFFTYLSKKCWFCTARSALIFKATRKCSAFGWIRSSSLLTICWKEVAPTHPWALLLKPTR